MTQRWSLHDLSSAVADYTVPINPNVMESPVPALIITSHAIGIDGVARGNENFTAHAWTFSGVLHEQAHYNALATWVAQAGRTVLTDHLNRSFIVRLLTFEPVPAGRAAHPWRHTYTVRAVTYSVVTA